MLVSNWLRTPQIRRGLAMASVVLAFGGLVLYRAPDSAALVPVPAEFDASTGAKFSGPGAHGSVALSHARVLANGTQDVYAEVRMTADKDLANARAPLALAVVLDTSGSMSGDKIEEAKSAVMQLVKDMRDDDQIAIVRYSDDATIIQHLARVGDVRNDVLAHIRQIEAGGGTAIPLGLSSGLNALGLVGALRVGVLLGRTPADLPARVEKVLARLSLPVALVRAEVEAALPYLALDKKRGGDAVRFVFVEEPGKAGSERLSLAELARLFVSVST